MIYVLIGVLGYAFLPIWVKSIQPSGLQPLDIATWRFAFATPIIWLLLIALRTPQPDQPLPRRGLLALGLLLAGAAISSFFGLSFIQASTFVLLFYSYPAMVALINFARGERLPMLSWLALALTTVGIALTVPDFGSGLTSEAWTGVIIAFLNAFLVAVYFIVNGQVLRGHQAIRRASAWAITGALLVMLVILPVRGGVTMPPDVQTWGLLLALAVISTVMPIFMFMIGIQRLGASKAAILSTVEPIGTLILATLILGETTQPIQLLGGALIISSVILLQLGGRKADAAVLSAVGD